MAVLVGLFFAWQNLKTTQEATKTAQESTAENLKIAQETLKNSQAEQIADRFTKAIDQLGAVNDKGEKQLEIRLGGIYALEQIAKISKEHHWPIMEVLTAYVREHAPRPLDPPKDTPPQPDNPSPQGNPSAAPSQSWPKPATDIQAVLTVLGRRDRTTETADQRLDLNSTNLRGADLRGANLQGAILISARLEKAFLGDARLEGAFLSDAHLTATQLCTVHSLYEAQLDPPLWSVRGSSIRM